MCDCLDEENEEGKPLTWTYVGQGQGDWAEAKNLEFVGHGKGAFIKDREVKPSFFCRSSFLQVVGCAALFLLVPVFIWLVVYSGLLIRAAADVPTIRPEVWTCASPPLQGAAAAGAAIMEEAWMALDLDMDGYIPKSSLPLWQSQSLMSPIAAKYLNSTEAVEGKISNEAYIQTLLDADTNAFADEQWISGAWLLCDKNQDKRVTKIEMGFLQRHGTLKESLDAKLWSADANGDGALDRDEFAAGLATVAAHAGGAIQELFQEVQTRYWPAAKKDFCCHTQGVCGLNGPAVIVTSAPSTTFAASYDCHGEDHVEGWTEMRRAWCCSRYSVGCFSSIKVPYDCNADATDKEGEWSTKKQEWCCFHVGKGCSVNQHIHWDDHVHEAYPVHTVHQVVDHPKNIYVGEKVHVYDVVHKVSQYIEAPFDCNHGFKTWKVGWSAEKKSWCCAHGGRGCEEAVSHVAVSHVEPATEAAATDAGENYDCSAGFSRWRDGWSLAKKNWCCKHEERGCA